MGISTSLSVTESDPFAPEMISFETLPLSPRSLASPALTIRATRSDSSSARFLQVSYLGHATLHAFELTKNFDSLVRYRVGDVL